MRRGDPCGRPHITVTSAFAQTTTNERTETVPPVYYRKTGPGVPLKLSLKDMIRPVHTVIPVWKSGSKDIILEQGFETTAIPPAGWTVVDADGDGVNWSHSTLNPGGTAHSGTGAAVSLSYSNAAGGALTPDNWLISPQITIPSSGSYRLSYWVGSQDTDFTDEKYGVFVSTTNTDLASFTEIHSEITHYQYNAYYQVTLPLTDYAGQSIYIAFRHWDCTDEWMLVLDDIVVDAESAGPAFDGATALGMGTFFDVEPAKQATYTVASKGAEALTLSLASATQGLAVANIPASLAPGESAEITVTLDKSTPGNYTGNFVLATNDPQRESVTVEVSATVTELQITGFQYQQFETRPEGWLFNMDLHSGSGIDGTSSLKGSVFDLMGMQMRAELITSLVSMGNAPRVKFYYKALNTSGTAASAADVAFMVVASQDFGKTFTTVYSVAAGAHIPSTEYALVDVDLSAYAGKMCIIGIQAGLGNPDADYDFYIDNMSIGTRSEHDLGVTGINGHASPAAGKPVPYTFSVQNTGLNTETAYSVKLMKEGDVMIGELAGVSIAAGETKPFEFAWTPEAEGHTYLYGKVVFDGDEEPVNNQTKTFPVSVQPAGTVSVTVGEKLNHLYANLPVNFAWQESATQTLYLANEIGTNGGVIHGLVFKTSFDEAYTSNVPVKIWIGETTKTDFADAAWVPLSELTPVFNGTVTLPAGDSNWEIELLEPYEYHGGNLVIYTVKSDAVTSPSKNFFVTETNTAISLQNYHGVQGTITEENPGEGSPDRFYPNITFYMNLEGMGGVSGVVTNAGGEPVDSVKVAIAGTPLYKLTNAAGEYSFPHLTAGDYTLKATLFGYGDKEAQVTIVADQTATQNFTVEERPKVTVSGTVKRADNAAAIAGATVTLAGYGDFETTTGADGGYVIENVWANIGYEITVDAEGFAAHAETLAVAETDVTKNILLNETPLPVLGLDAEQVENNAGVRLTWYAPDTPLTTYTLDDGTAESGWAPSSDAQMSLGNKIVTADAGTLASVDIYGVKDYYATDRTVTLDVYNTARQLVAASEPFTIPADAWLNVAVSAPFSGDLYVMVHWAAAAGYTNVIGYDENGANAGSGLNMYYTPADGWAAFTEVSGYAGIFTVRANAIVNGETKTYGYTPKTVQPDNSLWLAKRENEFALQAKRVELNVAAVTGNPVSNSASKAFVNYSVYRLQAGEEQDETAWETLTSTLTATEYTDSEWATQETGVYRYAVKANYTNLSSVARFSENIELTEIVTPYGLKIEETGNDAERLFSWNNAAKSFTEYIVYLDDENGKVAEGLTDTRYTLTGLTNGTHKAGVRAVYTSGESPVVWSEPFVVNNVGIGDNTLAGISVYGSGNNVCIVNNSGTVLKSVQITDVLGRVVYDGRGRTFSTPAEIIPVNGASGIYIVRLVSDDNKVLSTKVHLN